MTISKIAASLEATLEAYGEQASTGELVTMWNRLKVKGKTDGKVGRWVDKQLEQRQGWDMDRGGFLFMI